MHFGNFSIFEGISDFFLETLGVLLLYIFGGVRLGWLRPYVMLVQFNMTMELSNASKKNREPLNVTKVQSHVMLVLYNVRIVLSNVRKK